MKKECKVGFSCLTWPLKVAVISAWVMGVFFTLAFLVGFVQGVAMV